MGCGSDMTCWRRLRDWQQAGVRQKLQVVLPDHLGQHHNIDFSRAALDSAAVVAKKRGATTGTSPTDCGKASSKRHVLTDANGIPLALKLTGANVNDSRMLEPLVDAVAPVRQSWGPPRGAQASCMRTRRMTIAAAASP